MANGQHEVGDVDALFFSCVQDRISPSAILAEYGPRIDQWPSNVHTLGFGKEGTETQPAAAACIAAVGALAVRAEAGVSSRLSSHGAEVAATLSSTSMKTAFDSISAGHGRLVTLAIAANLNDPSSQPSLRGGLGEVSRISGMTSGSGHPINEVYYTNGTDLQRESALALERGLSHSFRSSLTTNNPSELLIRAYTALISGSDALSRSPEDPSAKLWMGALVSACENVADSLPKGHTLESVIPSVCYGMYVRATDLGFTGRPQGSHGDARGGSLPTRKRTARDAMQVGFPEGVPAGYDFSAQDVDPNVDPLSFTGQRLKRLQDSRAQEYLSLIGGYLVRYNNCQDMMATERHHIRQQRQRVERATAAGGAKLLDARPHVRPGVIRQLDSVEQSLGRMMDPSQSQLPPERAAVVLAHSNTSRSPERLDELTGVAAAVAMRRHDPTAEPGAIRAADSALGANREAIAKRLVDTIGVLVEPRLSDVPPEELEKYGLTRAQALGYEKSVANDEGYDVIPRLDGPPLHLLALAADVINHNSSSVLPHQPKPPKVRGTPLSQKRRWELEETHGGGTDLIEQDKDGNEYIKTVKRATPQESEWLLNIKGYERWQQNEANVNHITGATRVFLQRRYEGWDASDPKVVSALVECALAEERGFWDSEAVQQQVAKRANKAFSGIPLEQLPPQVHDMVSLSLGIANETKTPRLAAVRNVAGNAGAAVKNRLPRRPAIPERFRRKNKED